MIKKILKDIFSQKGIIILLFLAIISQVLFFFEPYLLKYYVDYINSGNLNKEFYFLIFVGGFAYFFGEVFSVLLDYNMISFKTRYQKVKNLYYFSKYFSLDYEYRLSEGTGKTITKISRGVDAYISLFEKLGRFISIFVVRFILIGWIMLYSFPPLFFIMLTIGIILTLANTALSKIVKVYTDKEQTQMEKIGRQTSKMVMESNLIKVLNKEKQELNILNNLFLDLPKLRQKIFFRNDILFKIMGIVFNLLELTCYAVFGLLVVKSDMTLGEMMMIILYIGRLWWPISIVMEGISEIRNQISKIESLEKLVNTPNKIKNGTKKFILKKGEIDFQNISFSYDEKREILNDFSLKIEGGKTIALVGHSGSGKSTLIKLILRNYLVKNGEILIDGQNIKDLKISTFYENIGYLSQEPAVFDGTIRENLDYATNKKLSDEDLYGVLKKVDLYKLIFNSKDKLNTEIGEKGLKLSGGEKQRLAIARIFLRDPKILILDEPTSSLDSISENKITKILNSVMKGRSVIVIAHRLQTVMEADKIIVLQEGKIIETGTHTELIKKKGVYSDLVDLQRGVVKEE